MNDDLSLSEKVAGFTLLGDQVAIIQALADADLSDADRRLARVMRVAEVMDIGGDNLAMIEGDVQHLLRIIAEGRNTLYSLTTAITGIAAAMKTLKAQRDDAVRRLHAAPTADALYADFVQRIVDANGCTPEDAQRIACVLTAPDEELLTYDVVEGYATLERFRQAVFAALGALDQVEVL